MISARVSVAKAVHYTYLVSQGRESRARRRLETVLLCSLNDAFLLCVVTMLSNEKSESSVSRGSMLARVKLESIDGKIPQDVESAA